MRTNISIFNNVKSLITKLNIIIDICLIPFQKIFTARQLIFQCWTIYDFTEHFSEQLTNFLDINILISSNLLNKGEADPQQKINRISTNFAKLLNQDENQQGYSLLCEILISSNPFSLNPMGYQKL
jgi:hypothetical protein